jgi:hypothetical protein
MIKFIIRYIVSKLKRKKFIFPKFEVFLTFINSRENRISFDDFDDIDIK